jgi:acyl carrier protein
VTDDVDDVVTNAWREVLERADIDRDADFFELGGDSLKVVRVVARVEEALGVELSVRVLLESRTPAGMIERVRAVLAGSGTPTG